MMWLSFVAIMAAFVTANASDMAATDSEPDTDMEKELVEYIAPLSPFYLFSESDPSHALSAHYEDKDTAAGISVTTTGVWSQFTAFSFVPCPSGASHGYALKTIFGTNMYLRYFEDGSVRVESKSESADKGNWERDTCFSVTLSEEASIFFTLQEYSGFRRITVDDSHHITMVNSTDTFAAYVLDDKNTVTLFSGPEFSGNSLTMYTDDADLSAHSFDNVVSSIYISGNYAWRMYVGRNYLGQEVTMVPGYYDADWLEANIGSNTLSSLKIVTAYDAVALFTGDGFNGDSMASQYNIYNVEHFGFQAGDIRSVVVVGPESWEFFTKPYYGGTVSVTLSPGRYDGRWVAEHIGEIVSVKKIEDNSVYCDMEPGLVTFTNVDGIDVDVELVHHSGSAWFKFGKENMSAEWNKVNNYYESVEFELFTEEELERLSKLNIMNFEVDSDVIFLAQTAENSYHPSSAWVFYLGSHIFAHTEFVDMPTKDTHLMFSSDHLSVRCGSIDPSSTLCGHPETGFPPANQNSPPMIISSMNMQPHGPGAHADNIWSRNKYTWSGSKYILYAKVTDCMPAFEPQETNSLSIAMRTEGQDETLSVCDDWSISTTCSSYQYTSTIGVALIPCETSGYMMVNVVGTDHHLVVDPNGNAMFTSVTAGLDTCFTSSGASGSDMQLISKDNEIHATYNGQTIIFTIISDTPEEDGSISSVMLPGYHLAIREAFASPMTFLHFDENDSTFFHIEECPSQAGAFMFLASETRTFYLYYHSTLGIVLNDFTVDGGFNGRYCFFMTENTDTFTYSIAPLVDTNVKLYVNEDGELLTTSSASDISDNSAFEFTFDAFALPEFLHSHDIWTAEISGCACGFNTNLTVCACCEDGGCQCGISSPNQCVRCGFEHSHCGKASVVSNVYELEVSDLNVGNDGDHYSLPEQCVTSCTIYVDTEVSSASEVSVHLTDTTDIRRLSCVVLPYLSHEPNKMTTVYSSEAQGVPAVGIDMYGFDGIGVIHKVEMTINEDGCSESIDVRYTGCYMQPYNETIMDEELTTSPYMTVETCISHCKEHNYLYSGLRMGTTCTCGDYLPEAGTAYDCQYSCAGDSDEICGGQTSFTIFRTDVGMDAGYFLTGASCANMGAEYMDTLEEEFGADVCELLTGESTDACAVNYCKSLYVVPGALYYSKQNRCQGQFISRTDLNTTGQGCINLGGVPTRGEEEWGPCSMDLCAAESEDDEVITINRVGGCGSRDKLATVLMAIRNIDCRTLGGATIEATADETIVECELDLCAFSSTVFGLTSYDLPLVDSEITVGSPITSDIPEMCVNVVEMYTWASSDADARVLAQFYHAGEEVSLYAESDVSGDESVHAAYEYSTPATGVLVDQVKLTAYDASVTLLNMKLYEVVGGCTVEPDHLILYDDIAFSGVIHTIESDSTSFGDFENRVSSFKVTGDKMWQVFEDADFGGRSVVLYPGEYYDTALLPFGDNEMSSARVVYNDDIPRAEISDAGGIICFARTLVTNFVAGTIHQPMFDNRPETFYFGQMDDHADLCEQACREEQECVAWTLFLRAYSDAEWAGGCYGRSFHYEGVEVADTMVVSGLVANCELEDTFNLYPEANFGGDFVTIVENEFNTTGDYFSVVITGTDGWRVTLHNGDIYQTYTAYAGQYADIRTIMPDSSFVGAVKLHPDTQYFGNYTEGTLGDFFPVIENQIEEAFPDSVTETEYCNETQIAEVSFIIDSSKSIKNKNFKLIRYFIANLTSHFVIGPDNVRVGMVVYSSASQITPANNPKWTLADYEDDITGLMAAIGEIPYLKGATYTNLGIDIAHEYVLNTTLTRPDVARIAIVITDGESTDATATETSAHLLRDDGVTVIAIGIKDANYEELVTIAGDQSRVYNVTEFEELDQIIEAVSETTCESVDDGENAKNHSKYTEEEVPGDDESYFQQDIWEFKRLPYPLGMESGVIVNKQIFARSSQMEWPAYRGRLDRDGGWISGYNQSEEWIEVDLGKILPIHGIATQGHTVEYAWVISYKIAISLDGINFEILKANDTAHLVFEGNMDQFTVKHHCLHRIFGTPIKARVVRFIIMKWHYLIGLRVELYGFRDADDDSLIPVLEKDVWTRSPSGCPCYFDPSNLECACCEDGGCQCPSSNRHQCVQCGYPHNCGTPSVRHMEYNVDGWTSSFSGCPCPFDKLRTDCACCQNYGCHCGEHNRNQCTNCGHPEHCGLKEWLFGPNPYCMPKTCPTSNTEEIESE